MGRNLISEIKSLKSRSEYDSRLDFSFRLAEIQTILSQTVNTDNNPDKELLKYIPIATVACFEAFFRRAIKELVDFGKPFNNNIVKFNQSKNVKLDFEFVNALQGKAITLGEFISHILPCNSFEDINSNLSTIASIDFASELKKHKNQSKFEIRNSISNDFCENHGQIISDVKRFFELRHIFCHEFAISYKVNKEEISRCFSNSKIFLNQANFYIWHLIYPNAPETQAEMNNKAGSDFVAIEKKMTELINQIISHKNTNDINVDLFHETLEKWRIYRETKAKLDASIVEGGTLYPTIYSSSLTRTTKTKIELLTEEYKIFLE